MHGRRLLISIFCLVASSATGAQNDSLLQLAGSTSLLHSGLYDQLAPRFVAETGYTIEFQAVGSGRALKLGRLGKADVLLTHAPEAEKAFIAKGYGLERLPVMHNDFMIIGPADDPVAIRDSSDAALAFQKIAGSGHLFLSRGDDSGTHNKEMEIWQRAGIDPYGSRWHHETGDSMKRTLADATQREAYTLIDHGTWLAVSGELSLAPMNISDPLLANPYSVIMVNPAKHPHVNKQAAETFVRWIRSPEIQQMIADYRKGGKQYFIPDALP